MDSNEVNIVLDGDCEDILIFDPKNKNDEFSAFVIERLNMIRYQNHKLKQAKIKLIAHIRVLENKYSESANNEIARQRTLYEKKLADKEKLINIMNTEIQNQNKKIAEYKHEHKMMKDLLQNTTSKTNNGNQNLSKIIRIKLPSRSGPQSQPYNLKRKRDEDKQEKHKRDVYYNNPYVDSAKNTNVLHLNSDSDYEIIEESTD